MSKEQPQQAATQAPAASPAPSSGLDIKKLLIIGVPIFLVQIVVIYFLMAKLVAPASSAKEGHETEAAEEGSKEAAAEFVYTVKDLLINPAGTNGTRYLLTTIGLEVTTLEASQELEKKDMQIRDAMNTILSSKGLAELVNVEEKEKIRKDIAARVGEMLKSGKLTNVYFSKFIIQ